jgi:hypothetical protein
MATPLISQEPEDGKYFITRRPPLHDLVASWMSPFEQPVDVTFQVVDRRQSNPVGGWRTWSEQVTIRSLARDADRNTIWFSGVNHGPGHLAFCAGFVDLDRQPWPQGLLYDTGPRQRTPLECGDLPTIRIKRAVEEAAEVALHLIGDQRMGEEIANRVVNHLSAETERVGAVCPECGECVSYGVGSKPICPKHGKLDDGAARLVSFAPCTFS